MTLQCAIHASHPRWGNSGGPMSRTRKERVRATLLGNDDGTIRCPRVIRVGITFPNADPVDLLGTLLAEEGFGSPEDLRDEFPPPDRRLIARPWADTTGSVDARYDARREVLWNALVLGLCTAQVYDPARPVLWTQVSLTRRLELFDPAGFYA